MTSPTKCSVSTNSWSRAESMMLGTREDERGAIRALLTAPVVVTSERQKHLGLLRDLSLSGVFFYTEFEPPYGAYVELEIKLTKDGSKTLRCCGRVIRVVHSSAGSALGVAVQAIEYELRANQR